MKSFYDHQGITIYHGDCREVIKHLADEVFDLVCTDPPYGIEYHSNHYKDGNPHTAIKGDEKYPLEVLSQCISIAKAGVLAFGRWDTGEHIRLPQAKSQIIWVKDNWSAGDLEHAYGRQYEVCSFWPGYKHSWASGRPSDVIVEARIPGNQLVHPTEKPVALIKRLVAHHKCSVVLDPFMGSGTALVAAKALNLRAVGIELEEKYCEIAAKRLQQEVMPIAEVQASF